MRYYDIHTHQVPVHPEDVAIINTIVTTAVEVELYPSQSLRSYGIHPWHIYNVGEQMERLRVLVSGAEVVAIGEAGLDKMAKSPMGLQKEVFLAQAFLAEEIHKPLLIHCVRAWEELIVCQKEVRPEMPWIIHGFRGNGELAAQLIAQGFYLSFGERFNPSAVRAAWPESLFVETDDKPVDIRLIYRYIAESLQATEREVLDQITRNFSIF